jgi:hypothetical protein
MRLIDADALYERACDLEAQALSYIEKIIHDEDTTVEEWRIWSAILTERTAFKHDIFDAPEVKPERKKGKWNFIGDQMFECSECGTYYTQSQFHQMRVRISDTEFPKFCPNCGADMREKGEDNERA